jgi:hypothetical protein
MALSYLLSPRLSVDINALRDPQLFIPRHVKGLVLFPHWIDNLLQPFDDIIIDFVQFFTNPLIVMLCHCISGLFSVEIAAYIPYMYMMMGIDHAFLHITCQSITLLIISQLPKRFMWRYRPYMVNRAKMASSDKTSSFPARTVSCGVVFTYILHITVLLYIIPMPHTIIIFYMFITSTYLLVILITSWSRIAVGAHYPSDCIVGAIQGGISCFVGDVVYNVLMSCPKDIIRANELIAWNWDNVSFNRPIAIAIIGLAMILISNIKSVSMWSKLPLILSYVLPSVTFSYLVCSTSVDSVAHYLYQPDVFIQHYIIFGLIFTAVFVSISSANGYNPIVIISVRTSTCLHWSKSDG